MTKKVIPLTDYISAHDAAQILTLKLGRRVSPGYIQRIKNVRSIKVNKTTRLYNRVDIQASTIRERGSCSVM